MMGAIFLEADLTKAIFSNTNLSNVNFRDSTLTDGYFMGCDLSNALIHNTGLKNVKFTSSTLTNVLFQPKSDSLPIISSIVLSKNLSSMYYKSNVQGLVQLRKAFRDAGFRDQEREITYAIKHTETKQLLEGGFFEKLDASFRLIFFDWTTNWSLNPGKALIVLVSLTGFFFFFYLVALQAPEPRNGIWRYRFEDRPIDVDQPDKALVHFENFWKTVSIAMYFSILSAFHFGWRDLNVGNWVVRLQFTEYTLRATGWVRTVSGIQSLISVYLVAIWALTYFGRPFE